MVMEDVVGGVLAGEMGGGETAGGVRAGDVGVGEMTGEVIGEGRVEAS